MVNCAFVTFLISTIFGLIHGRGIPTEESTPPLRIQQCREGCLEKFTIENADCLRRPECAAKYHLGGVPIKEDPLYISHCSFICQNKCWDQCKNPPPPKAHKLVPGTWPVRLVSMTRIGSLVNVDIAWKPTIVADQCLVTWEILGGGLMGNLLTDAFSVELSLWPDTHYVIQVTCESKNSDLMSRSLQLKVNTNDAAVVTQASKIIPSNKDHRDSTSDDEELSENDPFETPNVIHSQLFHHDSDSDVSGTSDEIMIGVIASVILFTALALVFIINRRRGRTSGDKEGLIENEMLSETRTLHV